MARMHEGGAELGEGSIRTKKWGLLIAEFAIKSPVPRSALFLK
jgi:hypothetical protein